MPLYKEILTLQTTTRNLSKEIVLISSGAKETQKFAADLARQIFLSGNLSGRAKKLIKKKINKALIVALEGELGSGKTTFIKGFSKALGVREKVLSPTFVLIHKHKLTNNKKRITNNKFKNFYHIDAYRLKSEKDLLKLGAKEIFGNPKNIVLIEWADRVKKAIPKKAIWIRFEHLKKNERKISINKL